MATFLDLENVALYCFVAVQGFTSHIVETTGTHSAEWDALSARNSYLCVNDDIVWWRESVAAIGRERREER